MSDNYEDLTPEQRRIVDEAGAKYGPEYREAQARKFRAGRQAGDGADNARDSHYTSTERVVTEERVEKPKRRWKSWVIALAAIPITYFGAYGVSKLSHLDDNRETYRGNASRDVDPDSGQLKQIQIDGNTLSGNGVKDRVAEFAQYQHTTVENLAASVFNQGPSKAANADPDLNTNWAAWNAVPMRDAARFSNPIGPVVVEVNDVVFNDRGQVFAVCSDIADWSGSTFVPAQNPELITDKFLINTGWVLTPEQLENGNTAVNVRNLGAKSPTSPNFVPAGSTIEVPVKSGDLPGDVFARNLNLPDGPFKSPSLVNVPSRAMLVIPSSYDSRTRVMEAVLTADVATADNGPVLNDSGGLNATAFIASKGSTGTWYQWLQKSGARTREGMESITSNPKLSRGIESFDQEFSETLDTAKNNKTWNPNISPRFPVASWPQGVQQPAGWTPTGIETNSTNRAMAVDPANIPSLNARGQKTTSVELGF